MLSFLTALVGALTVYGGYAKDGLFKLESPEDYFKLMFFLGSVFFAGCAWGHSLLAIKIGDCPILPKSAGAASYIKAVTKEAREDYIYNCYVDTLGELSNVIDEKSVNLTYAYEELTYSATALGLLALVSIIMEIFQ